MSTAWTRQHCASIRVGSRRTLRVMSGVVIASLALSRGATVLPATAAADVMGPTLMSLAMTPASINTATADATVVVTARLTDDLAGLSTGGAVPISTIELRGPGGAQFARGYFSQAQRVSGTALDGVYRTSLAVVHSSEPGTWLATIVLTDAANNATTYSPANLAAAGFANSVQQAGAGDNQAPNVVSMAVSPNAIDTSLSAATLTFSARIVDGLAGVSNGSTAPISQLVMQGPTGSHRISANLAQRVSGTALDGVYAGQVSVPRFSEQGQWSILTFTVYDNVGNSRTFGPSDFVGTAFAASFQQSGVGDINAPSVAGFTISPSIVDTSSSSGSITMRARLTDNFSGVASGITDSPSRLTFRSPSGSQQLVATFGIAQLQSGSELDGWYVFHATLPQGSEQGTWTLLAARLVDAAHNAVVLDATEWAQLSYPAAFDVRSDGTPSAPLSVLASPTSSPTVASVSWLEPAITGSSAVSSYTITASPGGLNVAAPGTANTASVVGLTVGVMYTFTVHATNLAGNGGESAESNLFIAGGAPDIAAPSLVNLSIVPIAIEATSGPASITVDLSATDDVSGLADGTDPLALSHLSLQQPDGSAGPTVSFAAAQLIAGTAAVGTYETHLTLPQGSMVGTWTVGSLTLVDGVGHSAVYQSSALSALGASTAFVITDAGTPGPPLAVSATAGDQSASVTWASPANDGGSPLTAYTVISVPGNITVSTSPSATTVMVTGLQNGTSYSFVVRATNAIGTGVASAQSNTVIPGNVDQTAPQLLGMSVAPTVLASSSTTQSVVVTAHISDAGSGVADAGTYSSVLFVDPIGADAGRVDFAPSSLVSGTMYDGDYSATLTVAAGAPSGTYPISAVVLIDRAGNQVTLNSAQLLAAGFPTGFSISDPIPTDTPPDAPTAVSAAGGDQSADVSWTAPVGLGTGGALTSYTIVASPGGVATTVDAALTSATVGGLTNGVSYTFTVTAANATMTSAASLPSNAVVPGGADLVAPTLGTLFASPGTVDPTNGPVTVTVNLHVDDDASGMSDSPPSSFVVRSPSGVMTTYTFSSADRVGGDAIHGDYAIPIVLTNADEFGIWSIDSVVLNDVAGNAVTLDAAALSPFTARTFEVAVVPVLPRVPTAPTNVVVAQIAGGVTVSWVAPSDSGTSAVTKYSVVETNSGIVTDVVDGTTSLFIPNGVLPLNVPWIFEVSATNADGTSELSIPSDAIVTANSSGPTRSCLVGIAAQPGMSAASSGTVHRCVHIGWSLRRRPRFWSRRVR